MIRLHDIPATVTGYWFWGLFYPEDDGLQRVKSSRSDFDRISTSPSVGKRRNHNVDHYQYDADVWPTLSYKWSSTTYSISYPISTEPYSGRVEGCSFGVRPYVSSSNRLTALVTSDEALFRGRIWDGNQDVSTTNLIVKYRDRWVMVHGTYFHQYSDGRIRFKCRLRCINSKHSWGTGCWLSDNDTVTQMPGSARNFDYTVQGYHAMFEKMRAIADEKAPIFRAFSLAKATSLNIISTPLHDVSFLNQDILEIERYVSLDPQAFTRTTVDSVVEATVDNMVYVDASNLETVKELASLVSSIYHGLSALRGNFSHADDFYRSLQRSLSSAKRRMTNLSAADAASAWLSARFGIRLTYRDTTEVLSAYRKLQRSDRASLRQRSRVTADFDAFHFKVHEERTGLLYYHWYPESEGVANLWNYGLFPNVEQAWDLIPLSFVVDWVTGVQDAAKDLDRYAYRCLFHVDEFDMSHLQVISKISALPGSEPFSLSLRHYTREVEVRLPSVPVRLGDGHNRAINVIDSVSIVAQRLA